MKISILNTQYSILNTQYSILNTQYSILNTQYLILENMTYKTIFEPFKIKSVEPIYVTTQEEREKYIKEAFYNPFLLNSNR